MATWWLIFVEKSHRLQVLRMLIMRRGIYTGEILIKILGEKKRRKIGDLFTIMIWRINDLVPAFFI